MSLGPVDDRMPSADRTSGGEADSGRRLGSPAHDGAHYPVDIKVGSLEEQRKVANVAERRLGATERNVQRGVSQVEFGSEGEHIRAANLDGDGRCDNFVEIDQVPVRTWGECAVQVEFGAGPPADRDRRSEPPLPVGRDRGSAPRCPDGLQGGSGSVESVGRHEQVNVNGDSLVRFAEQAGDRRPLQEARR